MLRSGLHRGRPLSRRLILACAILLFAGGAQALMAAGAQAEASGDLNGNGRVDENDLRGLNALCMKKPATHTLSCVFADLDGDGRVTPTDFNDVLRPKQSGLKRESPTFQLMKNCMNKPATAKISCSAVDMNGDGLVAPDDFFVLKGKLKPEAG